MREGRHSENHGGPKLINLWDYAHKYHIEEISSMKLHRKGVDNQIITSVLSDFARKHSNRLILYGGQTATPLLLGYKQMRTYTNDLDFVAREQDLPSIIVNENLKFHTTHGVFFGYAMDVIYTVTSGHIHNWEMPDDFFSSSRQLSFDSHLLQVCAPEYTIMMKFRRGVENGRMLFGKDAIDVINLIIAPLFRKQLPPLDIGKTCSLLKTYCGRDILFMAGQIRRQLSHLSKEIRSRATSAIEDFLGHLGETFL